MRRSTALIVLAAIASVAADAALLRPAGAAGGHSHRPGTAIMQGAWDRSNAAGDLNGLKAVLGITPAQEPAWDDYAATVNGVATQMQMVLSIVHQSVETASAEERADLMGRLLEARRRAAHTMREATDDLLAALEPAQRSVAAARLPGAD